MSARIEALRLEEARLQRRLVPLPRQDPESREIAGEIQDRLAAIQAEKATIARLAQEAAERRMRNRRRRGRKAA